MIWATITRFHYFEQFSRSEHELFRKRLVIFSGDKSASDDPGSVLNKGVVSGACAAAVRSRWVADSFIPRSPFENQCSGYVPRYGFFLLIIYLQDDSLFR